jgi:hypothetical protein
MCNQKNGFQKINGYNYYGTWHQIISLKNKWTQLNMTCGNMLFFHMSYIKTIQNE